MRILIDTNIFIYREDDQPIKENLQRLLRILNETNVTILIHPASIKEIEKDKGEIGAKAPMTPSASLPRHALINSVMPHPRSADQLNSKLC
jgi:hypothetical protein